MQIKRGRILRDASSGTGLISAEGQQYEFTLEGLWKSDLAPTSNMMVDIHLDEGGNLTAIRAIDDAQQVKEQAEKAVEFLKANGSAALLQATTRLGKTTLIALALIVVGWFFFDAVSIRITASRANGISFWDVLGALHSTNVLEGIQGGRASTGIYGFFAVASLCGPLLSQVWKDRRAHLGHCLPLVFMIVVAIMINIGINNGIKEAGNLGAMFGGAEAEAYAAKMAQQMMAEISKAISIGLGVYLSVAASLYLAFQGVTRYLARSPL